MSDIFALRRDFMQRFDIPAPSRPLIDSTAMAMWETMLNEEWHEFHEALSRFKAREASHDQDARIDAMAELTAEAVDVLNVLTGLLLSQGLPVEAMADAIHQANLRKCQDGKVVRRSDGKVLKPEGWMPADKTAVIRQALDLP